MYLVYTVWGGILISNYEFIDTISGSMCCVGIVVIWFWWWQLLIGLKNDNSISQTTFYVNDSRSS